MKRFTTVHSRFEVGDSVCGLVDLFQTRQEAIEFAKRHVEQHNQEDDSLEVVVYDRMASMSKVDSDITYVGRIGHD